jgi:hypothetical protein
MAAPKERATKPVKITDEVAAIGCAAGDGSIREEVWKDAAGRVVRYNLAFINLHLFAGDHGRVLGYDTAHGCLHRHFAGTVEKIEPAEYDAILERFIGEVNELRTQREL